MFLGGKHLMVESRAAHSARRLRGCGTPIGNNDEHSQSWNNLVTFTLSFSSDAHDINSILAKRHGGFFIRYVVSSNNE